MRRGSAPGRVSRHTVSPTGDPVASLSSPAIVSPGVAASPMLLKAGRRQIRLRHWGRPKEDRGAVNRKCEIACADFRIDGQLHEIRVMLAGCGVYDLQSAPLPVF